MKLVAKIEKIFELTKILTKKIKIMKIVQVIFSFTIAAIVAFWLISSIIKVGIENWQIALVLMQIFSILLVKISIKELKNENDSE